MLFDRNGSVSGSAISHTNGSGTFTIQQPGMYLASFNGAMAPASGTTFPANLGVSLYQDGAAVPGAASQHTFESENGTATVSFTTPVTVSSVPSTLEVIGSSPSSHVYSTIGLTVNRLGDLSSDSE